MTGTAVRIWGWRGTEGVVDWASLRGNGTGWLSAKAEISVQSPMPSHLILNLKRLRKAPSASLVKPQSGNAKTCNGSTPEAAGRMGFLLLGGNQPDQRPCR